jgi:hypothetical protein
MTPGLLSLPFNKFEWAQVSQCLMRSARFINALLYSDGYLRRHLVTGGYILSPGQGRWYVSIMVLKYGTTMEYAKTVTYLDVGSWLRRFSTTGQTKAMKTTIRSHDNAKT